jgi:hypothetical protein
MVPQPEQRVDGVDAALRALAGSPASQALTRCPAAVPAGRQLGQGRMRAVTPTRSSSSAGGGQVSPHRAGCDDGGAAQVGRVRREVERAPRARVRLDSSPEPSARGSCHTPPHEGAPTQSAQPETPGVSHRLIGSRAVAGAADWGLKYCLALCVGWLGLPSASPVAWRKLGHLGVRRCRLGGCRRGRGGRARAGSRQPPACAALLPLDRLTGGAPRWRRPAGRGAGPPRPARRCGPATATGAGAATPNMHRMPHPGDLLGHRPPGSVIGPATGHRTGAFSLHPWRRRTAAHAAARSNSRVRSRLLRARVSASTKFCPGSIESTSMNAHTPGIRSRSSYWSRRA